MTKEEKDTSLDTNIIKPKTDILNYGFKELSNGIKVLFISEPDTDMSSAALCVNIDGLAEKKDEQGLAHFCEHLISMGSKKYPGENEYGKYIEENRGDYNARTKEDKTVYYFGISNEAFEGALDRFAHMLISPTFNESSVEREIQAVDNEFSDSFNKDGKDLIN